MTEARVGVDPISGRTPIFQVLCGPFFGPGSSGMVASVAVAAGCGGSVEWAVFRAEGGTWQLILDRHNGAFLSKAGADIVERVGAPRRGDPHCAPSAWKTRIWHWNGSAFTASAWKVTLATSRLETFLSPDRKVGCAVNPFPDQVWCLTIPAGDGAHFASVTRAGAVRICNVRPADICAQNAVTRAPVLRRGQRNELRGIRCRGERQGLTCVVMAGPGRGKGFVLSAAGGRRIG